MKRRPVCLVCLLLMFCIWLMDLAGFARISGNPLPESVQLYIEKHPEAVICGEVQQYQATEYSLSAYLKHVCLIVGSEQIPIKNLRVFLKSNKEFPIGTTVKISGKLEEIPEPRNPGEFDSRQFYACQKIYYFMKNGVVLAWSSKYSRYGQFMQNLKSKIMQTLDIAAKEDAGIFEAMLLGEKDNLEDEVKIRYQMAGIIHILAISGVKTLKLDIPLVPETRINWAFMPLHIAIIYILKLCLDEEIIPRCRFPCSRGYLTKCINQQKKQ